MMRIVNQLETKLNYRPQIDDFYEQPSIQGLHEAYQALHGQQTENNKVETPELGQHTDAACLEQIDFIADPTERAAFKAQRHGIRRLQEPGIPLTASTISDTQYDQLRSHRYYSADEIPLHDLSQLLAPLRQQNPTTPKYLYGSAGGLYPVQTYIYIKPGRVERLAGGIYYYHPIQHQLVLITDVELDERIYNPHINRPIYQRAAFALFMVAELAAIAPLYQEHALQFSTIEAGLMTQLLRIQAPTIKLGICEIGELDFKPVRPLFALAETQELIYSMVGGIPEEHPETEDTAYYQGMFNEQGKEHMEREEEEF